MYIKSSCKSPFLGKHFGTITPEHFWMAFIFNGKELILDHQGEEAKYPAGVPTLFRSAPVEDYRKDICTTLCQYRRNISWEDVYNYKLNTCEIDYFDNVSLTEHDSCSPNLCQDETAFASTNYFINYLRLDETNLTATQLRDHNIMGPKTKIWIKSEASYYTVRKINVEKTFAEFLAEIGGNLGLFAGASILTLVEFGEFCVKIFKGIVFNKQVEPARDVQRGEHSTQPWRGPGPKEPRARTR